MWSWFMTLQFDLDPTDLLTLTFVPDSDLYPDDLHVDLGPSTLTFDEGWTLGPLGHPQTCLSGSFSLDILFISVSRSSIEL